MRSEPDLSSASLHRRRLAATAFATALVILLAAVFWGAYVSGGQDFRGYYAAGSVLASGQSPYDYTLVSSVLARIDGLSRNNPFYYPPWLAALVAPLTLLPYQLARLVWGGLSLAALALTFWILPRALSWPAATWQKPLVCLAVLYPAAWIALRSEQVSVLLTACLVGAVWAVQTGRFRLAGVLLALLLTKPTATFLPVAFLALYAARDRRWNVFVAAGVAVAALLAVPTVIAPGWWNGLLLPGLGQGLWQNLTAPGVADGPRINATLADWSHAMGLGFPAVAAIWALAAAAAIVLAVRFWHGKVEVAHAVTWAGVLTFVLTPYALEYDYVLMAPAIVALWQATAWSRGWRLVVALALWAAYYTIHLWGGWMSDAYWIPLIFLALGFVTGALPAALRGRRVAQP